MNEVNIYSIRCPMVCPYRQKNRELTSYFHYIRIVLNITGPEAIILKLEDCNLIFLNIQLTGSKIKAEAY